MPHLQRHGTHLCNCLTCGFNDKKQPDVMVCQFIDDHEPSCTKCTEGFAIICELKEAIKKKFEDKQAEYKLNYTSNSLAELQEECRTRELDSNGDSTVLISRLEEDDTKDLAVTDWSALTLKPLRTELKKRNLPCSGNKVDVVARLKKNDEELNQSRPKFKMRVLSPDEMMTLDILEERVHDIDVRKNDLDEYRSHLSRHKSEDSYGKELIEKLEDDAALVTCDYKMKLLSCFFRENQKNFLGKEELQYSDL